MPAGAPLEVKVDPGDFAKLLGKSSEVDAKLRTALRRNIRKAAAPAVQDARAAALRPGRTRSGRPRHTGLRQGIAAGITSKIMTGSARSGVVITASTSGLPESQRTLVRAWEAAAGWRHPIFARANAPAPTRARAQRQLRGAHGADAEWVTQKGNPFFRKPIYAHRSQITKAVEQAMTEAAASLKG